MSLALAVLLLILVPAAATTPGGTLGNPVGPPAPDLRRDRVWKSGLARTRNKDRQPTKAIYANLREMEQLLRRGFEPSRRLARRHVFLYPQEVFGRAGAAVPALRSGAYQDTDIANRKTARSRKPRPPGGRGQYQNVDHSRRIQPRTASESDVRHFNRTRFPFLADMDRLYRRGFEHSKRLGSRPGALRPSESTRTPNKLRDYKNGTSDLALPASLRNLDISLAALPYVPGQPYMKAVLRYVDNKLTLCLSAAYEQVIAFKWTLNGRIFDEFDSAKAVELGTFHLMNKTYKKYVYLMEILHLPMLPTKMGSYQFDCSVVTDFTETTLSHVVRSSSSDDCPPADCYKRHAICKAGKCVCDSPYPVRLDSIHATCRSESILEAPCHYDEQCSYNVNHSECVDLGWCACRKGYGRLPNGQCALKTGVNARCDSEDECLSYDARCVLSHCICPPGFVELNGRCVIMDTSMNALSMHAGTVAPRYSWAMTVLTVVVVTNVLGTERATHVD